MPPTPKQKAYSYQEVIDANIALHSKMASEYNTCEPHFRPENVQKIEGIIARIARETGAQRLLDLGCGTGFVINIAKNYVREICGVDVTPAMMARVDTSGPCMITLHEHDSGSFPVEPGSFDVVTGYSFLHHLQNIRPTLETAFRALKRGGKSYFDLDPNFYFWEGVHGLDRRASFDPIVRREIDMVVLKDEDIAKNFGIEKEVFNAAEYGKAYAGGFREESLRETLASIGFSKVDLFYHWFVGQGVLINDPAYSKEERFTYAAEIGKLLQKAMPLSRNLFKYVGFIAEK